MVYPKEGLSTRRRAAFYFQQKWDFNFCFHGSTDLVKSNVPFAKRDDFGKQVGTIEVNVYLLFHEN